MSPTQQKEVAPQDAKRRPLKTFPIGDVRVSVWPRDVVSKTNGENLRFYSVTTERVYRDKEGKPRYTGSLNPEDIGAMMKCLKDAGDYINKLQGLVPAIGED